MAAKAKGCVDGNLGGLASSDAFLRSWGSKNLASPAYRQGGLLVITFDESDFSPTDTATDRASGKTIITLSAAGEHCCEQRIGPNVTRPVVETFVESPTLTYVVNVQGYGGDRIGALLLSPFYQTGQFPRRLIITTRLLRTFEDFFGLEYLGSAAQSGLRAFGPDVFTGLDSKCLFTITAFAPWTAASKWYRI